MSTGILFNWNMVYFSIVIYNNLYPLLFDCVKFNIIKKSKSDSKKVAKILKKKK